MNALADGGPPGIDAGRFRQVLHLEDDERAREASARRISSDVVSIDGLAYIPVPEPRFRVSRRRDVVRVDLRAELVNRAQADAERDPYDHPTFRADRLDDMQEFIRERWPGIPTVLGFTDFELLEPTSISYDDEREALLATAAQLLDLPTDGWKLRDCLFGHLATLPSPAAAAWFALRDLCADGFDGDDDLTDLETALAALEPAIATTRWHPPLRTALRRWGLRPLEEAFITNLGPR